MSNYSRAYSRGRPRRADYVYDITNLEKGQLVCKFKWIGNIETAKLGVVGKRIYRDKGYRVFVDKLHSSMIKNVLIDYLPIVGWFFKVSIKFQLNSGIAFLNRDIDNMVKPVLDAATGLIWRDDRYVTSLVAVKEEKMDGGKDEIEIKIELEQLDYRFIKQCQVCGKRFITNRTDAVVCSVKCAGKRSAIKREPHIGDRMVICHQCGRTFLRNPSQRKGKNQFCDKECYNTFQREGRKLRIEAL